MALQGSDGDRDQKRNQCVGRPTKYSLELGRELISWMEQGYSLTAAAARMGFARQTIYNWADQHPEFLDSVNLAKGLRTFKLESDLLAAESGPTVTSRIFALKNAAPDEWREKQSVEHGVSPESPLARLAKELAGTALRPRED
jgi:hypothetical protein